MFKQRLNKLLTSLLQRNSNIIWRVGLNLLNSFTLNSQVQWNTRILIFLHVVPHFFTEVKKWPSITKTLKGTQRSLWCGTFILQAKVQAQRDGVRAEAKAERQASWFSVQSGFHNGAIVLSLCAVCREPSSQSQKPCHFGFLPHPSYKTSHEVL